MLLRNNPSGMAHGTMKDITISETPREKINEKYLINLALSIICNSQSRRKVLFGRLLLP